MSKPAFTFHHLFSSTYKVSLSSGDYFGNVEIDNGLVEPIMLDQILCSKGLLGSGPLKINRDSIDVIRLILI